VKLRNFSDLIFGGQMSSLFLFLIFLRLEITIIMFAASMVVRGFIVQKYLSCQT